MALGVSISIILPPELETMAAGSIAWAATELQRALAQKDVTAEIGHRAGTGAVIEIAGAGTRPSVDAPVALPQVAEGMALYRHGDTIVAWGYDSRGLVYALTELADRVRHADGDDSSCRDLPLVEQPSARIRSIARLFCSEEEDKGWFYDRQLWLDYLSMLASNRFNRFSLTFGIQYDYPYHNHFISDVYLHFPYPFLLDLPGYGIASWSCRRGARRQSRNAALHRPRGGAARAGIPARAVDPAL